MKQCDLCTNQARHWFGRFDDEVELKYQIVVCSDCKPKVNINLFNDYETIERG